MGKIRQWKCMLLCCFLILSIPMQVDASEHVNQRTVKVGYFEADGYHIMNEDGTMSGYGFDFLQMMLRYNDWTYEYVGYDKNWGDMLELLDSGEIDMVTLANITSERLEKYDFSEKSIGTSSTIMTIRAGNTDIITGEYDTYDGAKIGLVEGSSHNEKLQEYADLNGFTYTPVYYGNIDDMLTDLRSGKNIDIAVTSNMRQATEELILAEFNATEYYAIVKKGNEDLLKEIDHGIAQLDVYSPNWRQALFQKYYSNINDNVISLSADERAYIAELAETGTVITVAMNPELKPYSYFENGEAKGIAPAIFKEIASRLGIEYEILYAENRWEYKEQLSSGEACVDLTAYLDYSLAQLYNLKETDAYMTSALAMVTRRNSNIDLENMVVAAVRDSTEYMGYNQELIYSHNYVEYESIQECIDAVKNGDADVTFRYVYVAEQAVREDYRNQLQYSILQDNTFQLAIGVSNDKDHRLLSILNKGVNSISDAYTDRIILEETTNFGDNNSLIAMAYDNPVATVIFVMLFFVIFVGAMFIIFRMNNQKKELLAANELERFVGYVCSSNEMVQEINLETQQRKIYELDHQNRLITRIEDHIPFDQTYFQERVNEEDLQMIQEIFSDATIDHMIEEGGGERYFECRIRNDQGEIAWHSYVVKAIPKDLTHPRNFIVFKKNIQESKQEEEKQRQILKDALATAQRASSAKGIFVSRISHEIRTPLNAIIGYINMALELEDNKEKLRHCLENGKSASAHLLDLINDVLDMSAIENNKLKISNEEFDLKDLLTTISSIYYNQAEQKGVKFEVEIKELTEEWLIGDSLRVKQILMNLLSNAVKFTPKGQRVTFAIEQVKEADDQIHIRFLVKDTGIGMEAQFLSHIFDAFEQENASVAQKYGGSGLGLSITKNLVDLMEGSIQVTSEKNAGTTFTVLLAFGKTQHESSMEREEIAHFSKVRALVVDSDKNGSDYMKDLLKRCGIKCDMAESVPKAIKKIIGRKETDYAYGICILDWTQPEIKQSFLEEKMVEQCGEKHPIMIAMAYDVAEVLEEAKVAGIDRVIAKPLFQSTMYDILITTYGDNREKNPKKDTDEALQGISVLLVEDNDMNLEIATHLLEKAGMIVDTAKNGEDAYVKFNVSKPGTYQAILMDIQMPVMNGYEATQAIRNSNHPEATSIPIIALTANAFAEDISAALNAGMNEHISKPIDTKKLYRILKKFI